jgi:hypothetical protein
MIQYTLKCADGHTFDSWFQSGAAFDKLAATNMVSCAVCGSTRVEKSIMAPRVRTARDAAQPPAERPAPPALSEPAHPAEQALAGAATNYAYSSYYQSMAEVHFGLRRLAIEADRPETALLDDLRSRMALVRS